jgi:hypothetical protein
MRSARGYLIVWRKVMVLILLSKCPNGRDQADETGSSRPVKPILSDVEHKLVEGVQIQHRVLRVYAVDVLCLQLAQLFYAEFRWRRRLKRGGALTSKEAPLSIEV